ncbi:MAG TPA: cytochrome c biogenesis protein CcdA [Chitinophagaceae bacterium]|nr:cytochrome c biogenesis protein CcdA [Chitinophagaceae bacterium]
MRIFQQVFLLPIVCLACCFSLSAQDSTAQYDWKASSKRINPQHYELVFETPGVQGWQLYSPDQVLIDLPSAAIHFNDSAIQIIAPFQSFAQESTFQSPIFEQKVKVSEGKTTWKISIQFPATVPQNLMGKLSYSFGRNDEFKTEELAFSIPMEGGVDSTWVPRIPAIDINHPVNDCGDEGTKNKSILSIFLLGLLGGLIALLTPCVFPMIPVTVTFFTKKSADRKRKGIGNAALYGFFIFFIYILITVPFHVATKTINPEIFNNISTNVWLNLFFFAIFIVFAISFFGFFEIVLPSRLANKMDSKSGMGNIAGIFFMAGTLTIVSFSCTGPILGTLLANVAEQGAWPLTVGAAGFGLALGLPFALFAMFPGWLQSLPKSGSWMTTVKVVLGFLELALAIKFLSNADLVKQWGLLKREVFIGLWILISVAAVIYLLGWIRFPHSPKVKKFGLIRILFILLFSGMTVYLVPGLFNTKKANLKWISGFPPPLCYSIYSDPVNCRKGLRPLDDYKTALAKAKKENKPLLIDFTGWACVNCRKMEESVWTDPVVDDLMHQQFVVVSLYVDERRKLPILEQGKIKTERGDEKTMITVGDKWATFQTENFGATSQPQYAILSPDEKALTKTKFYTPNPKEFVKWLECGLEASKKNHP